MVSPPSKKGNTMCNSYFIHYLFWDISYAMIVVVVIPDGPYTLAQLDLTPQSFYRECMYVE